MLKNKKIVAILFCALLLVPSLVFAQTTGKLTNPLPTADVPTLIGQIIKAVLGIVGSIALLMFIYGGFMWLTSAGSEQKITKGKNIIVWAVIGLAVIFMSYALVGFLINSIAGNSNNNSATGGAAKEMGTWTCTCGGGSVCYTTQGTPDDGASIASQYKPCTWSPGY